MIRRAECNIVAKFVRNSSKYSTQPVDRIEFDTAHIGFASDHTERLILPGAPEFDREIVTSRYNTSWFSCAYINTPSPPFMLLASAMTRFRLSCEKTVQQNYVYVGLWMHPRLELPLHSLGTSDIENK